MKFERIERTASDKSLLTGWSVTKLGIRLGPEPAKAHNLAAGDFVAMLFDREEGVVACCKTTKEVGFRLIEQGRRNTFSGTITIQCRLFINTLGLSGLPARFPCESFDYEGEKVPGFRLGNLEVKS